LEAPAQPTVYVPYRQDPFPAMTFVVRSEAPLSALAPALRQAIGRVDKHQPVSAVKTMDQHLSNSLSRRRFGVTLLTIFGAIAVSLAAVGLYGVLAFIVAQRRREIGVRMARGARPRDVIADVVGQGLRLAGVGVLIGLGLAFGSTELLSVWLYGTSAVDVATYAAMALLTVTIATAASLVPALRASRVDPLTTL